MTDQADVLAQLSNALAARVAAVRGAIVAIRLPGERHLTGTLWQPDVVVASEQSLPKRNEFELIMPGGSAQGGTVSAKVAGRDPGTNIALLRLAQPVSLPPLVSGPAEAGALALVFGADGVGGTSVRMGAINQAGPEWTSSAGARRGRRAGAQCSGCAPWHHHLWAPSRGARHSSGNHREDRAGATQGWSYRTGVAWRRAPTRCGS